MIRSRTTRICQAIAVGAAAACAHVAFAQATEGPEPTAAPAVYQPTPAERAPAVSAPEQAESLVRDAVAAPDETVDRRQIDCMAKVIVHEAGNQPQRGQIAVAQVIRTRMRDGRFGADACSVVKQRGQFFDVDAYEPARSGDRWQKAVLIAADTLRGHGEDVVPGALFFHAAGASIAGRTRIAQVADHIFYR